MDYEKKLAQLSNDFGTWWEKGFSAPEMTNNLYPYEKLFSPIQINSMTIKNRLVMGPMGNISMCEETGRPNAKMLKYFEERAKGGVGLITTGLVPVSFGIDTSLIELGKLSYFPRIDRSRTVFAGWRDLAAMCHSHGSKICIQLTPGLGRVGNPQCLITQKKFPRSASFNPNWYMKDVPCLRLSDRSMRAIIRRVGQGAADAKSANIDGVYLHGHEGYLLEQCTNSAFNRRKLGKYSNYETFGLDMVKEIRRRVGEHYPIMYRIDLSLMLNHTYKDKMNNMLPLKKFKNERTAQQTMAYMKNLVRAGVDMFDVDLGCYDNWWLPHPPGSMPSGCFLDIAEIVKKYFEENNIKSNKGLPVPIVAVGKLGYPDLAEQALRDGKCDMVMLARPLLSDPDWCNKAYAGKTKDIIPCIGCQEGCINEFVEGGHPQCAVNPRTAFEEDLSKEIPLASVQKRVAVVGAGPAGIMAVGALLERGHRVVLFEKEGVIGGNIVPGSFPIIKYEIKNYLQYLNYRVEKYQENENFTLKLSAPVDADSLKAEGFDAIIIAAGTRQSLPPVKGIDKAIVHSAVDILKNPDAIKDARRVVVIGGGVVGTETAYFLKYEHHKPDVKVVEMDKYFMNHTCTANRGYIIHYLEEANVELLNCTTLTEVLDNGVKVNQNRHKNVPNPYNTWAPILPENVENPMDKLHKIRDEGQERTLEADAVVVAAGVKSADELFFACQSVNAAPELYNIGDSFRPAKIFDAVKSAYRKARSI
jgi:2-enoate reductase